MEISAVTHRKGSILGPITPITCSFNWHDAVEAGCQSEPWKRRIHSGYNLRLFGHSTHLLSNTVNGVNEAFSRERQLARGCLVFAEFA